MSQPLGAAESLAAGRAALANAEWSAAEASFRQALAADDSPEAWEGLSRAAWWEGDLDVTLSSRERAYRGYRRANDALKLYVLGHLFESGFSVLIVSVLTRVVQSS